MRSCSPRESSFSSVVVTNDAWSIPFRVIHRDICLKLMRSGIYVPVIVQAFQFIPMAGIRRIGPPAGTLLAKLREQVGRSMYSDCFEISLDMLANPAVAAVPALAAAGIGDSRTAYNVSMLREAASRDSLTTYMRHFYTSKAFTPERALLNLVNMPCSDTHAIYTNPFDVGDAVGPFIVCHRGQLAASDAAVGDTSRIQLGCESALEWASGGLAGLSYHAILLRYTSPYVQHHTAGSAQGPPRLSFLFGSALWRPAHVANRHGQSAAEGSGSSRRFDPVAAVAAGAGGSSQPPDPDGLNSAASSCASTSSSPPALGTGSANARHAIRHPGLAVMLFGPVHRVYSKALLIAAVDKHLRLELL